jgi:hypothetical protein
VARGFAFARSRILAWLEILLMLFPPAGEAIASSGTGINKCIEYEALGISAVS